MDPVDSDNRKIAVLSFVALAAQLLRSLGRAPKLALDDFSPLSVRQPDHGALSDILVCTQQVLNLQGRDLVAAGLDDIDTLSSKNAVQAVFDHSDVARLKPALAKRVAGRFWSPPVFQKHTRPTYLDLAWSGRRHWRCVFFVNKSDIDTRQWRTLSL